MKNKWLKYIGVILLALFLTIGVPILINELYKVGAGYITMWKAPDVLAYYGTLLGSFVTIATLAITIIFTRKQIARDSFLKSEHEKWDRIEADFADALDIINPMIPFNISMHNDKKNPSETIRAIEQYMMTSSAVRDKLSAHLSSTDVPKVKDLIDAVEKAVDEIHKICFEVVDAYEKLDDCRNRELVQDALTLELHEPSSLTPEMKTFCQKALKNTVGLCETSVRDHICDLNVGITTLYRTYYRPLIQQKVSTFEEIHKEIKKDAERILRLGEK